MGKENPKVTFISENLTPPELARTRPERIAYARNRVLLEARDEKFQEFEYLLMADLDFRNKWSQQRQFDILKCGEHRDQIERLKNVSDVLIAPARDLRVVETRRCPAPAPAIRRWSDGRSPQSYSAAWSCPTRDRPSVRRNSPFAMSIDTSSSAVTWNASRLKTLLTPRA